MRNGLPKKEGAGMPRRKDRIMKHKFTNNDPAFLTIVRRVTFVRWLGNLEVPLETDFDCLVNDCGMLTLANHKDLSWIDPEMMKKLNELMSPPHETNDQSKEKS